MMWWKRRAKSEQKPVLKAIEKGETQVVLLIAEGWEMELHIDMQINRLTVRMQHEKLQNASNTLIPLSMLRDGVRLNVGQLMRVAMEGSPVAPTSPIDDEEDEDDD